MCVLICIWMCVHICEYACMCVCVCDYACVCVVGMRVCVVGVHVCVWIWMCILDTPLFFAHLYWFSWIQYPDLCFLYFLHCCFSSVGRQLKCQAFSDVCPLVQYGKGDMPGGGGVKWDSVPTVLLQERSPNALECQVLISLICGVTERCRAGAGVQSGTYCQIQIFSEFDYWCSSTDKGWICMNSKNNCFWRISTTPYTKAKHPYTANVMHELQKMHTVRNVCLYWSWIYI